MKIRKGLSTATALLALGVLGASGATTAAASSSPMSGTTTTSSKNVIQIAEHTPQLSTPWLPPSRRRVWCTRFEGSGPFTRSLP